MGNPKSLKLKGQMPDSYIRALADECQVTDKQARYAVAVAFGANRSQAAKAADLPENNYSYLLLSNPRVQKARRMALQARIEMDAKLAYEVILDIATDKHTAPTVKFQAATKILELAGHGVRQGQGADDSAQKKDLADMSVDELREFVQAGAVRVSELREARTVNGQAVRVDDADDTDGGRAPGCAHLLGGDDPLA